jgi:hypothetical protein
MKHTYKNDNDELRFIMTRLNWLSAKDNPTESEILQMKELYQRNLILIKKLETKQQINSN